MAEGSNIAGIPGDKEKGEMQDDAATAEFVSMARGLLAAADPSPASVATLAKLAFGLPQFPTVEVDADPELALSRGDESDSHVAKSGNTTLVWSVRDDRLSGVLSGSPAVSLAVQAIGDVIDADPTPAHLDDGFFEVRAPARGYRFLVSDEDSRWATAWMS